MRSLHSKHALVGLMAGLLAGCAGPGTDPDPNNPSALTIVGSLPSQAASDVPVSAQVSVTFSAPVDASKVSAALEPSAALGQGQLNPEGTELSFANVQLAPNTSYTLSVQAQSAEGVALSGSASIRFSTGAAPDTSAPSLTSSLPANGAAGIASNAALELRFSEPIDAASLLLQVEPEFDFGPVAWSSDGKVATFANAPQPLAAGVQYKLIVNAADLASNPLSAGSPIVFTVAAALDTLAPTVESSAPAAAATQVPTNSAISISFSEPMDQVTAVGALSIAPSVGLTSSWDAEGRVLTVQPAALAGNTQYTVTVGAAARDLAQNQLGTPFSFSFHTGAAPDTTRPTVASSIPAAGDTGVARGGTIKVTFSEPMDKAATQAAFSITAPAGYTTGSFSWSADGKTMTFDPVAQFQYGEAIAWRVTTAARDLAGNTLLQMVSRGFIVVKLATVVIDSSAGLDGYVWASGTLKTDNSTFAVGDNLEDDTARGFLSFDLSGLPTSLVRITSANIYVNQLFVSGDVTVLGGLKLERVYYGASLTASAWNTAAFTGLNDSTTLTSNFSAGWKLSAQLAFGLNDDWNNRASRGARSQFRLRFVNTSYNKVGDYVQYVSSDSIATNCPRTGLGTSGGSCRPHLVVSYEYP